MTARGTTRCGCTLRALGLVKNAGGQGEFLREKLQSLSENERARRVLISGSADDAIVHVALTAFRDANRPLELTLVDCCETPLALSRWSTAPRRACIEHAPRRYRGFRCRREL